MAEKAELPLRVRWVPLGHDRLNEVPYRTVRWRFDNSALVREAIKAGLAMVGTIARGTGASERQGIDGIVQEHITTHDTT